VHVCEEDHRCCDVAKFYGVDLELLVEKNKSRYKALNKVIRLKAGTVLLLPLPGETKESIAAEYSREKERLKKKRKLEEPTNNADGAAPRDKKAKSAKGAAVTSKGKATAEPVVEVPEESVEEIMSRATEVDTPQVCGFRQVCITDRLPFNVTRPETEPHKWDEYRDSTLNASSFAELGVQLIFMEGQILSGALRAAWEAEHRAGFAAKCALAKTAKEMHLCMQELFMEAIDWAAVDKHWDLIEDEEAAAAQGQAEADENEAPAALAKTLAYTAEAVQVYVEDEKAVGGKRHGRLYIGRHPKTGFPIWMVEVQALAGENNQQVKASAFVQQGTGEGGRKNKSHFLRRIFLADKEGSVAKTAAVSGSSLHDWLVDEGHMGKPEGAGKESLSAMRAVPPDVESKLAQAMTRMMQLIDRVPFAAVKNKKQDLWEAYGDKIIAASGPAQLAVELKWFVDQLISKMLAPWWVSSAKGSWEVSCDRVVALKDFYMVLMELEDDAINWKAVDARWVTEVARAREQELEGAAGGEKRTHKKKEKLEVSEGVCPLPLPLPQAAARLPEGWKIEVKSCTVWRPEECYVVFRTPDGYCLHSIDHVLKYYQKQKMLPSFSESVRKGFVAAQQEAKAVHNKHMQRIAKFLLPMPDIPMKFLDEAKDTNISRETRLLERSARQDKIPSPKASVVPAPKLPAAAAAAVTTTTTTATSSTAAGTQGEVSAAAGAGASAPEAAAQTPAHPAAAAEMARSADADGDRAAPAKQPPVTHAPQGAPLLPSGAPLLPSPPPAPLAACAAPPAPPSAPPPAPLPAPPPAAPTANTPLAAATPLSAAPLVCPPLSTPIPAQPPAAPVEAAATARGAGDAIAAASALPALAVVHLAKVAETETQEEECNKESAGATEAGVGKKRPRNDERDAGGDGQ
jgi:hypothetical protein